MPEEQMQDDNEVAKEPLFETEPVAEDVVPPKEDAPKGAPLAKEKQDPILPLEEFWSGVRTGIFVAAKAGYLDTPNRVGDKTSIDGNVSFDAEGIKISYPFEAFAVKVLDENPASCRLELNVKPMMKLIAGAIQKYKDHGEMFKGDGYYRAVREAIPGVFEKVFAAIKQNSKQINWTGASSKHDENAVTAVITLTHVNELEPYLDTLLDKSAVKSLGSEILVSKTKVEKTKQFVPPTLKNMAVIKRLVLNIPEEKFTWKDIGMFAALPVDEVKEMAGENSERVMQILESMPDADEGTKGFGDMDNFWAQYYPKEGFVLFENKQLSDKAYLKKVNRVYRQYGGGSKTEVAKAIAKDKGVSEEAAESWLTKILKKFTPGTRSKVDDALGIKKVSYPSVAWAGPTLEQVGALVGPDKAMLASEWASSLADKLNYTSYTPSTLVGGPGDIKKLAAEERKLSTLALTDTQRALVEKYRAPAIALMNGLLESHPIYDEEDEGGSDFVKPDSEEVSRLAEDVLLDVVENLGGTSKSDDSDFMNELKSRLWTTMKRVQQHHQTAWPSTHVGNPEDVQILKERSYDPVKDQPEALTMEKKAFHEGDAIQLNEEYHHPELRGRMGKICDIKGDIYMCPEHGPEPVVRYLVDLGTDAPQPMTWVVDGEFNSAGSTN